jgi:hypothetical protein
MTSPKKRTALMSAKAGYGVAYAKDLLDNFKTLFNKGVIL